MSEHIIEAGMAYAKVISALHGACFDAPWDEKAVAEILTMPKAAGLIIGPGGGQGFVLFRLAADEAEILTIGVAPGRRRKGLAGRLLQAAIERAGQAGASRMFLEVAHDNTAARAFYEKAGFVMGGRRPGYYDRPGGKTDALVYCFEITPSNNL